MCRQHGDRAAAIVLAAGSARRFGDPKLLLPFGDSTIIGCVIAALEQADLEPIIVVAGEQIAAITEALKDTRARVICNPLPARGMTSSLRVGVAELPENVADFLVALGDQPSLRAGDVRRLLEARRRSGKGIALPTHHGKRGHPVSFDGRYRAEIVALGDSDTLRDLIHAHGDDTLEVDCSSDAVLRDIDTPEEYREELRLASQVPAARDQPWPGGNRGLFGEIARLQQSGRGVLLATPLWAEGSVPFRRRAKLLLRDDGSTQGTIGGGLLEARCLAAAREAISDGRARILEFELTAADAVESGMICGGHCAVLLEPIAPGYFADIFAAAARAEAAAESFFLITLLPEDLPPTKLAIRSDGILLGAADPDLVATLRQLADQARAQERPIFVRDPVAIHLDPLLPPPSLFVFGAGHIALPLVHMASLVGFRTAVIDDRADFANPDRFPDASHILVAPVSTAFSELHIGDDSYVVAVTRGHAYDEEVVAYALQTPARYIGMIGSRNKIARVFDRLRQRGFPEKDLARVHAPIGLEIGAETVEEIAVSILAQLLQVRRATSVAHCVCPGPVCPPGSTGGPPLPDVGVERR